MNFPFTWTITVMAIGKQPSCLRTQATAEVTVRRKCWKIILLGPNSEQCGSTTVASQCLTSKDVTPSKSPVLQKPSKQRIVFQLENTFPQIVLVEFQRYLLYLNTHCTFNTAYWFNDYEDEWTCSPCSGLILRNIIIMKKYILCMDHS